VSVIAFSRCGITQSMGDPGSLDNAVIEPWHSTVEFELRRIEQFTTKAQARAATWIEEYNRDRRHSALGMHSPLDYERALREHPSPEAA
jgi:transposase InsO family protein